MGNEEMTERVPDTTEIIPCSRCDLLTRHWQWSPPIADRERHRAVCMSCGTQVSWWKGGYQ